MDKRTVNIDLKTITDADVDGVVLYFKPEAVVGSNGEVLIRTTTSVTVNSTGVGTVDLPIRPTGSIRYRCKIGNDGELGTFKFYLEAGAAIDIWQLVDGGSAATQSVKDYVDEKVAAIPGGGVSLGETSSTAYRGDRGKTAYDHSQLVTGNPHSVTKANVGLSNVDNTSDSTKNTATATLTNKTLTAPVINSPTGLVKGDVGLGNVDNISDLLKPVSTAQAAALALKADLASPALTGNPTAPTQTAGNASTRLATTDFVSQSIASLIASAPGTLDTLNEIATALGNDPNFAATMTTTLAGKLVKSANLSDLTNAGTARTNLGLGTLATQNGTFSGISSGANTGDQTTITGNAGTATALATARAIYGNNFDGTAALAQIIASTFGGTGNGFTKFSGPATAERTFTLPNSSETLLYSGGALGTPSSGTLTNCTFPTLNQNTSGYAEALKSATTTVSVSAATAPTSGQVLTATSGTAATWQTPSGGGGGSQTPWTSDIAGAGFNLSGVGSVGAVSGAFSGSGKLRANRGVQSYDTYLMRVEGFDGVGLGVNGGNLTIDGDTFEFHGGFAGLDYIGRDGGYATDAHFGIRGSGGSGARLDFAAVSTLGTPASGYGRIGYLTGRMAISHPLQLPTLADASAPNSSLYFSSTASKLVWKDSGGTVNNLY